jgi:hypothetical protein
MWPWLDDPADRASADESVHVAALAEGEDEQAHHRRGQDGAEQEVDRQDRLVAKHLAKRTPRHQAWCDRHHRASTGSKAAVIRTGGGVRTTATCTVRDAMG